MRDPMEALEAARRVNELEFYIGMLQGGGACKERHDDGTFSDEEHAHAKRELDQAEDDLIDASAKLCGLLAGPSGYPMSAEELRAAYGVTVDDYPQRVGQHVIQQAQQHGWKRGVAEDAFTFMMRRCREVALEDARGVGVLQEQPSCDQTPTKAKS